MKTSRKQVRNYHFSKRPPRKKVGMNLKRWILLSILLVLFLIFFTGNRSLQKLYSLYQEKQNLIKEKEKLEKTNKKLEEEIYKLQHDKNYLEKIAREKHNMKKPKEDVYHIIVH